MTGTPTWPTRLRFTSNIIHVGVFVVAVVSALISTGITTGTVTAISISGIGIVVALTTRVPFTPRSWRGPIAVGAGIITYSIATALTGGSTSVFALLPVAAIFLAAVGGGIAMAGPAFLAAIVGILLASSAVGSVDRIDTIWVSAVYALTAIAFSEVQRAITLESEKTAGLILATQTAQNRSGRLTAAHDLLEDLVTVATSPDINAVATAHDALRDLGVIAPDASARIVADGEVVLAHRGASLDTAPSTVIPITWRRKHLARLEIWSGPTPMSPSEMAALEQTIAPVGLAIDNDLLLQRLAGITIQRERVRLSRELHDDIAPSLASVGLALDMVLMAGGLTIEQTRTLKATRSNITRLVDTIRGRVQDLRADRTMSIVEMAHSLVAEVDADGPTVLVDIDERTPPRPAIAAEIGSLLAEGFRNAVSHANASMITITGRITETGGLLTVKDDGTGFTPSATAEGRFGLLGMRERANLIGAELTIESASQQGTTITVTWTEDR